MEMAALAWLESAPEPKWQPASNPLSRRYAIDAGFFHISQSEGFVIINANTDTFKTG
jgi:hypothetical protein